MGLAMPKPPFFTISLIGLFISEERIWRIGTARENEEPADYSYRLHADYRY